MMIMMIMIVWPSWLTLQQHHHTVDYLNWVMIQHVGTPARTNSRSTIYQHHGNDRQEGYGLNADSFLFLLGQQRTIFLLNNGVGDWRKTGINITRRGTILSSKQSGSELTIGHKQVKVVTAYKILSHADDGLIQGLLTVMIEDSLTDIAICNDDSEWWWMMNGEWWWMKVNDSEWSINCQE